MAIGTVLLALLESPGADPSSAISYALDFARLRQACLRAIIAAPPLIVPAMAYSGYAVATQMLMFVEQENVVRKRDAEQRAARLMSEGEKLGVDVAVHVASTLYESPVPGLLGAARTSDVCIMSEAQAADAGQRDLFVDMLFGAGVPVLAVPADWSGGGLARRAIVAWDASRAAARAVHDALPLLESAETVEVVCVRGEKEFEASAPADIEQYLSRHCRSVSATVLATGGGGVAAALRGHTRARSADLLVMGAYGHSRLREFVLGGATRDMLAHIAAPTLMSH